MAMTFGEKIWHNGTLVPWRDATVHVLAHGLHYGSCVFEGIRAYPIQSASKPSMAIFQLDAHIKRLIASARLYRIPVPYSAQKLKQACKQVLKASGVHTPYLRPLVYRGLGDLGVMPKDNPSEVAIAVADWGPYLGHDVFTRGIRACISSWNLCALNTVFTMSKASGHYLGSQLMTMEARRHGYDEAIALDVHGCVGEGPSENIFLVQGNVLVTPPVSMGILPGVMRQSVITLAQHEGLEVRQEPICRDALYLADELFFTGTAAEITPIGSVDGLAISEGRRGPITHRLQQVFLGLFDGTTVDRWGWLDVEDC